MDEEQQGTFASRDIEPGELIMVSNALAFTKSDVNEPMEINWMDLIVKTPEDIPLSKQLIELTQTESPKVKKLGKMYWDKDRKRSSFNNTDEDRLTQQRIDSILKYSTICRNGSRLWFQPSFIHHSCEPNCTYVYYGSVLVVKNVFP